MKYILPLTAGMAAIAIAISGCNSSSDSSAPSVSAPLKGIKKVGSYITESEIVTYDKASQQVFIIGGDNKLNIVSLQDETNPAIQEMIDLSPFGAGVNSVTSANGLVAVAMEKVDDKNTDQQINGSVEFFSTAGVHQQSVEVGYLPDMLTFNEDGSKVVVANEGEPNGDYSVDPEGSVGVINVADYTYTDISLASVDLTLAADGTAVRLGGTPSDNQAKDLEPEYIAVSGDYAFITLQENNAMIKVNLMDNSIEYIKSYGAKSYAEGSGNTIDIEEEGTIKMQHYPGLYGLYQPDSIAAYMVGGETYVVTANEGDGREYLYAVSATDKNDCEDVQGGDWDDGECLKEGHVDEKKISKLDLDDSIASAYADDNDLKVMTDLGDDDGDGKYEKLYTYGARSFSIWDDKGDLVWDSGDEISKKVAEIQPELFNQANGEIDGRSGNKGAEPEALTVGVVDGKTYAFVGLERQSAIVIYDITTPTAPTFVDYHITHTEGNVSPEGMKFISADDSPSGIPLLLVAFEYDPGDAPQATVVYEIVQ